MVTMDLQEFITHARKNTWAGGGGKKASARTGSEGQFVFEKEGYRYEDEYFGSRRFQGQEVVYLNGRPAWGMVYAGGVPEGMDVNPEEEFAFLKQALMAFTDKARFPGKVQYEKDKRAYGCEFIGTMNLFLGREYVKLSGQITHEVFFTGGKIDT